MTNKKIKNIIHKEELYASVFNLEEIAEGLDFLTNDESFIQVGTWKYEKGKVLDAHYHNTYERKAYLTQEVVIALNGTILCKIEYFAGIFLKELSECHNLLPRLNILLGSFLLNNCKFLSKFETSANLVDNLLSFGLVIFDFEPDSSILPNN